ncbi:MAG: glutathione S-transferase N-terminal domain-containing protein [Azospirillaceae bacterium]|nr:glutathione S-transferase N-terminal domain-containing protein [Azospirillaceae bacterium]
MSLTFYYAPGACSLGVHIALEEAAADYTPRLVQLAAGEQRQPDYLAINPSGRVPALRTPEGVLTECAALLTYVARRHPQAGLLPDDAFAAAQAAQWLAFLGSSVHVAFAQSFRPERHTDDPAAQAALKAAAPARVRAHLRRLEDHFAANRSEGRGPWLLGDRYSVADPYALVFHRWLPRLDIDPADYPAWGHQADRLYQRPAVRRALEQEGLAIPLSVAA